MALWVFTATALTSTVLVPIFLGLYWKRRKTAMAGPLSCVSGLVSVIVYYVGVQQLGVANEIYGTYIWTFTVGGSSFALWQEYALFLSLPASFLGFLIGNRIGQPHLPTMPPEVSGVIDPLLERAV